MLVFGGVHSLKLTARPWKMVLEKLPVFVGWNGLCSEVFCLVPSLPKSPSHTLGLDRCLDPLKAEIASGGVSLWVLHTDPHKVSFRYGVSPYISSVFFFPLGRFVGNPNHLRYIKNGSLTSCTPPPHTGCVHGECRFSLFRNSRSPKNNVRSLPGGDWHSFKGGGIDPSYISSGQFIINPYPNLRPFWRDSLTKPPFGVTSAEVVINCPDIMSLALQYFFVKLMDQPTDQSSGNPSKHLARHTVDGPRKTSYKQGCNFTYRGEKKTVTRLIKPFIGAP